MPYKDKTKRHSLPISNMTCLCLVCKKFFQPYRFNQLTCSLTCRNTLTARKSAAKRGDLQRGRGAGKGYTKEAGRHQHRVVAEKKLGRALLPGEIVHHIDGNFKNNLPENLEILSSQSVHCKSHGFGIRKG